MKKLFDIFGKIELYFCVAIYIIVLVLLTFSVFFRYVLNSPITWADETVKYVFCWLVFISAAYTAKKEMHICIDAMNLVFPKVLRPWTQLLGRLIWLAFSIYMTILSAQYTKSILDSGFTGIALGWLQTGYIYLAIPVGYALLTIHLIFHLPYWRTEFKDPKENFVPAEEGGAALL